MRKQLEVVSATQVSLFRECPRRWWFQYLAKIKPPATDAMNEGLQVHLEIESYLKKGQWSTSSKWPALLQALDKQLSEWKLMLQPGVESEKPIRVRVTDKVWFSGAIDILDTRGDTPIILDVKSKASFNYVLEDAQLSSDLQLAVYALWVMNTYQKDVVELRHVYLLRNEQAPSVKVTSVVVTREQVLVVWDEIIDLVHRMVALADEEHETATEFPGNEHSCFKFSKCFFLDRCDISSPLVGLRVPREAKETKMAADDDALESLRKKKAERLGGSSPPTVIPAPPVAARTNDGGSGGGAGAVTILPPDAPSRTIGAEAPAPAVAPPEKPKKASKAPKAAAAPTRSGDDSDTTVYIGCGPVGREVAWFQDWVRPIEKRVAEQHRVAHPNLIEYHATGIMATAIEAELGTLPEEIRMHGNEPSAGVFLAVLRNAKVVQ